MIIQSLTYGFGWRLICWHARLCSPRFWI